MTGDGILRSKSKTHKMSFLVDFPTIPEFLNIYRTPKYLCLEKEELGIGIGAPKIYISTMPQSASKRKHPQGDDKLTQS